MCQLKLAKIKMRDYRQVLLRKWTLLSRMTVDCQGTNAFHIFDIFLIVGNKIKVLVTEIYSC